MTKFLLDSGDPQEYREIKDLTASHGQELWGSTTNPSLIAKKLTGKKLTTLEAFALQKELVMEIVSIVPGAVSAEVYADQTTPASEMIEQGLDIATWHERVVVKLPTTLEGFKARTELRKNGITINNTLVFSQEQVFAITKHEELMKKEYGPTKSGYPSFISPFLGRLDDKGENGLGFVKNAISLVHNIFEKDLVWMLAASIRNVEHFKGSLDLQSELMTAPAKAFRDWFALTPEQQREVDIPSYTKNLTEIPVWMPNDELKSIDNADQLISSIEKNSLDITHPLTTAGIDRFVADWKAILQ